MLPRVGGDVNINSCTLLRWIWSDPNFLEGALTISIQSLKTMHALWPSKSTFRDSPEEITIKIYKDLCLRIITEALFAIAKSWQTWITSDRRLVKRPLKIIFLQEFDDMGNVYYIPEIDE